MDGYGIAGGCAEVGPAMVNAWETGAAALGIDALVGYPRWWSHPMTLMGAAISSYDQRMNREALNPGRLRMRGVALAFGIPLLAGAAKWTLVWVVGQACGDQSAASYVRSDKRELWRAAKESFRYLAERFLVTL